MDEAATIAAAIPEASKSAVALAAVARTAAAFGAWDRATSLAKTIGSGFQRVQALADIARMTALSNDPARARPLIERAEHDARSIRNLSQSAWALNAIASALAGNVGRVG